MKKLLMLLFLIATNLNAAPQFSIDYATFRVSEVDLLQIYIMIQRNSLTFQARDSIYAAEFNILTEIKRADSALASTSNDKVDKVASLELISPSQKIPEESSFHIRGGEFVIEVKVMDLITGEARTYRQDLTVKPYSWDSLAISDIEFASNIKRVNERGLFVKNQLLVVPHADRIYGGDLNTAYYYAEIYNLAISSEGVKYTVKRTILDQNGQVFKTLPEKVVDQKASSVVEADMFSCASLSTGTYELQIEVTDGITGKNAVKKKKFWVTRLGEMVTTQKFTVQNELQKVIDKLSDEEVKKELLYIGYLTSRADEKVVSKLKPSGYRNFLFDFWSRRDQTGLMRQQYYFKIELANQRFGSRIQEGWKTDRGRVLILYGEPSLIERRLLELSGPDSEIWHYDHLEGGVIFLFSDLRGTGDLQQVYSTMRGEFIDAGWVQEFESRDPGALQELIRNR
jgi:GWxTD domain-containing protein